MSSVKLFPIIVVLFITVSVFTIMNIVGQESVGNSNLDNKSLTLITNLNSQLVQNFSVFNDTANARANLSINETVNQGIDAFALQFIETKQRTSKFDQIRNSITSVPDLMILGINDDISEESYSAVKSILIVFIIIVSIIVLIVAIFGEGRVT